MEDDTDLPPSLDDPGTMDDHWQEKTTITVDRWCKAQLDYHRDGQPWNEYLESLRRAKADPITLNDVGEIADAIVEELNGDDQTPVTLEATEYTKIAEEIEARLR